MPTPLVKASQTVGQVLKRGDVVIYESTVYPGDKEHRLPSIKKPFLAAAYIGRA